MAALSPSCPTRAWQQAIAALGTIEFAERGFPGHDRFARIARSLVAPAYAALGARPRAADTPAESTVRRQLALALGLWGDEAVIADMRQRFSLYASDRAAETPDEQAVIIAVVARHADAATFGTLNALAVAAPDLASQQRDFAALALVADPELAAEALRMALSDEIPPQAEFLRLNMVTALAALHPQLSWDALNGNLNRLTARLTDTAQTFIAQSVPATYWHGIPGAVIDDFVQANVAPELADDIERGRETLHFLLTGQSRLVGQADALPLQ